MSPFSGSAVKANYAVSVVLVLAGVLLCAATFLLLGTGPLGPLLQTSWVRHASLAVPGAMAILLALAPLSLAVYYPDPRSGWEEKVECEETETFGFQVSPPLGKRYVGPDAFAKDLGLGPVDESDAPDAIHNYDDYIQRAALFKNHTESRKN